MKLFPFLSKLAMDTSEDKVNLMILVIESIYVHVRFVLLGE